MNSRLVEDLTAAPFDFVELSGIWVLDLSIYAPERFGHKFLDFLGLVDAESERGRLAWSIGEHTDSCPPDRVHEFVRLES